MKRLLAATALAPILHLTAAGLASAQAQYLSEVRLFGSNFCPVGWLKADGRLMEIAQNTALFSATPGTVPSSLLLAALKAP